MSESGFTDLLWVIICRSNAQTLSQFHVQHCIPISFKWQLGIHVSMPNLKSQ